MDDAERRKIAAFLTEEARNSVVNAKNGSVENSYNMISQFWSIYLTNANVMRHSNQPVQVHVDARDVAEMLSLTKKVLKIYGEQGAPEPYIDDLAFSALGGSMAVESPFLKEETEAAAAGPYRPSRQGYAESLDRGLNKAGSQLERELAQALKDKPT